MLPTLPLGHLSGFASQAHSEAPECKPSFDLDRCKVQARATGNLAGYSSNGALRRGMGKEAESVLGKSLSALQTGTRFALWPCK